MANWKQTKNRDITKRMVNKGALETDIEAFNARLDADGGFSFNRRRADRFHDKRAFERELKEVWE